MTVKEILLPARTVALAGEVIIAGGMATVREAAGLDRFSGSPSKIASALRPPVQEEQVRDSLRLLAELGMIERSKDGQYRASTPRIVPGDVDPALVRNIKKQMLLHAMDRLETGLDSDALVSSVTLAVSRHRLAKLADQLKQFRLDLLADTATDDGPLEQVVQVNFQLIPFLRAVDE